MRAAVDLLTPGLPFKARETAQRERPSFAASAAVESIFVDLSAGEDIYLTATKHVFGIKVNMSRFGSQFASEILLVQRTPVLEASSAQKMRESGRELFKALERPKLRGLRRNAEEVALLLRPLRFSGDGTECN